MRTPTRRIAVIGASKNHGATNSTRNIIAVPSRNNRGGKEWKAQAWRVGKQVDAKWYSRAVKLCHVGQSAVTLTTPLMTMNFTHNARRGQAMGWPLLSWPLALIVKKGA